MIGAATARPPVYRGFQYVKVALFVAAVALVFPNVGLDASQQNLVNIWLLYSIAAVGFYLVFGIAGRFAFSQAFMMALGGYASAWATDSQSFWLGMAAAIAITAGVAAAFGWLVRRSDALYFAIATLALSQVGLLVFQRWTSFAGPNGTRQGIRLPTLFGYQMETDRDFFWLFVVALAIALFVTAMIERAPLRREAMAGRDIPLVAQSAGIPVQGIQLGMFVLGSVLAGVAGALFAQWQGFISTDSFSVNLGIGILLMLVLGGVGSMWGPLLGAAFYVFLPDQLGSLVTYQQIVYGGILVGAMILLPQGLVGLVEQLWRRVRGKPSAGAGGPPNPVAVAWRRFVEVAQR